MTAPSSALISLQNVAMTFEDHKVLENIRIDIAKGETLVVIGESGCGKTVLLKLIIALLKPTAGKIVFDGKVLADLNDYELTQQRLRFGFLFQGAALFDSMSVFDNVAFGLREQPTLKRRDLDATVRQRLQEVGLPDGVDDKKPAELSGGMKKRVGLARALALNPEVMLYDEPTTGLDPIMSDVINELIVQTRQKHPVTSIVVTHDMKTAQKVADRVIMLYPLPRLAPGEGQILFDGPPDRLRDCPEPRVRQFIEGEAGGRLKEMAEGK
jgi:phospholipid/cholesterol/gamma-HCH transport system ATP-binding protein